MAHPWFFSHDLPPLFHADPTVGDTRLACRLLTTMQQDPRLRHERICIEVQNRVVVLEGTVSTAEVS
ncbi:BON domain-containing protein, partial [Escherichia coli]|nr:BON domain-containing protein [Escherichia coli]